MAATDLIDSTNATSIRVLSHQSCRQCFNALIVDMNVTHLFAASSNDVTSPPTTV